jgi:hypothetical protein
MYEYFYIMVCDGDMTINQNMYRVIFEHFRNHEKVFYTKNLNKTTTEKELIKAKNSGMPR